jgi:hypothetical protein
MHAEGIDGWILKALCDEPGPWRLDELERDHGNPAKVRDGIARLVARGLVLRMEGAFVVASASGRYANAMAEERS